MVDRNTGLICLSLNGRLNRQPYILYLAIASVLNKVGTWLTELATSVHSYMGIFALAFWALLSILLLWSIFNATAQRLHDLNLPAFPAGIVLTLSPIAIAQNMTFLSDLSYGNTLMEVMYYATVIIILSLFVLCLVPGTKGPNKYGLDPLRANDQISETFS